MMSGTLSNTILKVKRGMYVFFNFTNITYMYLGKYSVHFRICTAIVMIIKWVVIKYTTFCIIINDDDMDFGQKEKEMNDHV